MIIIRRHFFIIIVYRRVVFSSKKLESSVVCLCGRSGWRFLDGEAWFMISVHRIGPLTVQSRHEAQRTLPLYYSIYRSTCAVWYRWWQQRCSCSYFRWGCGREYEVKRRCRWRWTSCRHAAAKFEIASSPITLHKHCLMSFKCLGCSPLSEYYWAVDAVGFLVFRHHHHLHSCFSCRHSQPSCADDGVMVEAETNETDRFGYLTWHASSYGALHALDSSVVSNCVAAMSRAVMP